MTYILEILGNLRKRRGRVLSFDYSPTREPRSDMRCQEAWFISRRRGSWWGPSRRKHVFTSYIPYILPMTLIAWNLVSTSHWLRQAASGIQEHKLQAVWACRSSRCACFYCWWLYDLASKEITRKLDAKHQRCAEKNWEIVSMKMYETKRKNIL